MRAFLLQTPASLRRVGFCLGCLVWSGHTAAGVAEGQPLRVITRIDAYPYSFLDESGNSAGFSTDLLDAAARVMAVQVERRNLTATAAERPLAAGDYDVVQVHTLEPAREPALLETQAYLVLRGALFVRRGENRFADLADVQRAGVRLAAASPAYQYARGHGIAPSNLLSGTAEECLQRLLNREVDAVLLARLTGVTQARRMGVENQVEVLPTRLDDLTVRYGFAVPAGKPELFAELSEALAVVYQSGEYGQIYEKWFARYERPRFNREQLVALIAGGLSVLLAFVIWAWLRQRQLRTRLARQAEQLAESRSLLAEAQQVVRLGHWQHRLLPQPSLEWSEETYRVFERDPALGPLGFEELTAMALDVEERALWRTMITRAEKNGRPYDLDVVVEPKPGLRKTINVRGRPTVDDAGRTTGLFGTVQDVTAWRTAEAALRQSEQVLRALYANLPHALGVVEYAGGEWRVVSLNPEALRLLALDREPAAGVMLVDLGLAPERLQQWTALFSRSVAQGSACKTEMQSVDGRRDYAVTVVPLGYVAGNARSCFLVEDITDRKHKDAELAQSRRLRAIGELVGGIAHEFNNLLTPILLKADLLQMQRSHDAMLLNELRVITEAARRSAELTRRLLAFGRKNDVHAEWVDARPLVDSVLDLVRQTIDRRIRIECLLPTGLPKIHLVPGDLHQILINLLLNARDTLMEKLARSDLAPGWIARITIDAQVLPADAVEPASSTPRRTPVERWVRLSVRDNGLGMERDVLERIFEPFYTTKQVGKGTGLGLATVWHLVTDAGGRIDVESTTGEGSTFFVSLPVRPPVADTETAAPPTVRPAAAPAVPPRRVLLVEDEEIIARLVLAVLRHHGHAVTLAANGRDGWQLLSASPTAFDLVLMDLNMPGINGLELARRARSLPYKGHLVIMSGHVTDDERDELKQLGAAAILPKPFKLEELLSILADLDLAPANKPQTAPAIDVL
ncbi:MAG TPA: transporter substrate-binding domain-containing protein [Opitutaceae bacterium]